MVWRYHPNDFSLLFGFNVRRNIEKGETQIIPATNPYTLAFLLTSLFDSAAPQKGWKARYLKWVSLSQAKENGINS